jgi:hypothetical protein
VYAVATFVIVAVLSMLFTRVATGALITTGLPSDIAAFQARSAYTGSGFTTTESEMVVNHPLRRKVLSMTMLVGNLGTPTLIVAVLLGFLAPGPGDTVERLLTTLTGLVVLLLLMRSKWVTKFLVSRGQHFTASRLLPALATESDELLNLGSDFVVAEVPLINQPGLTPRSLRGLDQALPGTRLLGIRKGGTYLGEPPTDFELTADDVLVIYGRRDQLHALLASPD